MTKGMILNQTCKGYYPRTLRRIKLVERILQKINPATTLEIGCGDGNVIEHLEKYCVNIEGIEPSKEMVKVCKQKWLNVKQGNIYEIEKAFPTKRFDCVLILATLPHLPDIGLALLKAHWLLSENGWLIVSAPNAFSSARIGQLAKFTEEDYHYHFFEETTLKNLLVDSGFEVWGLHHIPNLFWNRILTILNPVFCDDLLFVCKKVKQ